MNFLAITQNNITFLVGKDANVYEDMKFAIAVKENKVAIAVMPRLTRYPVGSPHNELILASCKAVGIARNSDTKQKDFFVWGDLNLGEHKILNMDYNPYYTEKVDLKEVMQKIDKVISNFANNTRLKKQSFFEKPKTAKVKEKQAVLPFKYHVKLR